MRDKVNVKVLSVDDKGKIALSIKQTQPAPEKKEFRPKRDFVRNMNFASIMALIRAVRRVLFLLKTDSASSSRKAMNA